MNFRVHRALHEETNSGWVWARRGELVPRSIVRITNTANGRVVCCEYREIDRFFLQIYCRRYPDNTMILKTDENPIVISFWYRNALGIRSIEKDIDQNVDLIIQPERLKILGMIRTGSQHPDIVARLATRLGILGVWLGAAGIATSLLFFNPSSLSARAVVAGFVIAAGLLGVWLSKGVRE